MEKKRKLSVPHVYILLLAVIAICAILSYVMPASVYDMKEVDGREIIQAETWHQVDKTPVTLMQFLTSVPRGMQEAAQIIFFIFIVGGSFAVLQETRAIEAGMGRLVRRLRGWNIIILPIVMFLFSLCGSVFGMAEETIPFIPIFVSLCIAMGYDSLTGTAIVLCGAGAGFAGAFINPFTIQVAQGIAELPLLSGMGFRIAIYVCMVLLTMTFVVRYASKIKKDPTRSLMYEADQQREDKIEMDQLKEFGGKDAAILIVFLCSIILLIVGVIKFGWYMNEIAALFFGISPEMC